VDAGVHHLQGKAEGVTSAELLQLLRDLYLDRLGLLLRHEASAIVMGDYDINNAYQYVLNREETHVYWVHQAIVSLGGSPPDAPAKPAPPARVPPADVAAEDARLNQAFIDKWHPRIEAVTDARHRGMLKVMLGEMLEQKRFFEQAAQGRTDLLGLPMPIHKRVGQVLGMRWVE
jgi:hypothetical protein